MDATRGRWTRAVFRLRGLPNTTTSLEDAALRVQQRLGDIAASSIRVFSLATTLNFWERPPSKVATLMLLTTPSMLQHSPPDQEEWSLDSSSDFQNAGSHLILDVHFMGMTPLSDADGSGHMSDCIAISGLASHPFGSWQPKGDDKTFMWIRDGLPRHLQGTRAIIYGYDTKLWESTSFQSVRDLANELINQLEAYGWGSLLTKPLAFVAHSLGGLVLKDALVQLGKSTNGAYKTLLSMARGAVFFGVPNLGMEQEHLRIIAQDNPNEALLEDIARNSNYLKRLNDEFARHISEQHLLCFWAFETSESPTVAMTADRTINRNGPSAILVSRGSATCRLVDKDPSATFAIKATHSGMVKFTRDSHYYHVVVSKLRKILSLRFEISQGIDESQAREVQLSHDPIDGYQHVSTAQVLQGGLLTNMGSNLLYRDFANTTFQQAQEVIRDIQTEQERNGRLMYMRRVEPFLQSIQQFGKMAEHAGVQSRDLPLIMASIWVSLKMIRILLALGLTTSQGPMTYILGAASSSPDVFHSILDAYQDIGEELPFIQNSQTLFTAFPHLKNVLVMIHKDISLFHREAIDRLKTRAWKGLFEASWRDFVPMIQQFKQNIAQSKHLLESRAALPQYEEIQNLRLREMRSLAREKANQDIAHRALVIQWLSHFNCEGVQNQYRQKRSICQNPGSWLIGNAIFREWLNPSHCSSPLLWLSGIPGAGKTILASVVVDEARQLSNATVIYFYCKYEEDARNTFMSVARSTLAQLLAQNSYLLPYFHEKASLSSDPSLTSKAVAKEMIQTALSSCQGTWMVLDGIDECPRDDRIEIASFFRKVVETHASPDTESTRCLFVSQEDGVATDSFRGISNIKIADKSRDDLKDFAESWHQKMEAKFGRLRENNCHIANIITAKAQGMFIFAELFAKFLESQFSRAKLLEELDPAKLPVDLNHVYERILHRILEGRGEDALNNLRQVLGWIVCARRSLQWREIQVAISIDLESEGVDHDRRIAASPKDLFASLVEVQADGTVELVHGTARKQVAFVYTLKTNRLTVLTKFIDPREVNYSLAMVSMQYLSLPQVDQKRSEDNIETDLIDGFYPFYDYASACWAMHLQSCLLVLAPDQEDAERVSHLQETLETFVDVHWSPTSKPLADIKRIEKSLLPVRSSELFGKMTQAVAWARRQAGKHGEGPSLEEALDLWQVTKRIRNVTERMHQLGHITPVIQDYYGDNLFKCPRVNCQSYHLGFRTRKQRDTHVDRHTRPFLCIVAGCHMQAFGCATEGELKKHLFEFHGVDFFDNAEDDEFPEPPKKKEASKTGKAPATFKCNYPDCSKSFTRNHNLQSHIRTHEGTKPFGCPIPGCDKQFTRKTDYNRHQLVHNDSAKGYSCSGPLLAHDKTWGCQKVFKRADKLADHLRSKTGQKCLWPLVLEKLQAGVNDQGNIFTDQVGENADTLLAVGRTLPSFAEFLALCKIDASTLKAKTAVLGETEEGDHDEGGVNL
ncbi:hypothetical protein B0H67DRAFT_498262 [Lasiosphaeris hirsuta]|uniref:C2H2-type domain-containing protein n=1 Tax=Lasiosphaeris hirsuta TaxID=260670 RepID=A0AA39ZY06_9PEZI|nr:hypothetical protein B0H67DRAFT_498262 [Lasiosphaeris hirsuta]